MTKKKNRFVVLYDNGSGFEEWASEPQESVDAAVKAAGRTPAGYSKRIKAVSRYQACACGSGEFQGSCRAESIYCG